jgi:hypothetical protein
MIILSLLGMAVSLLFGLFGVTVVYPGIFNMIWEWLF